MAAPLSPVDVRREIATKPLSNAERAAFDVCKQFAKEGKRLTQYDICAAVGSENWNGGTMAGILNRLENNGYIERVFYQRGLQVCIPDIGCTAAPPNQAIHWRKREQTLPTPPIQRVRERMQSSWSQIEARAKRKGISVIEHIMDLIHTGNEITEQSAMEWGE